MGGVDDFEGGHPYDAGAFDGDFAVVGARDYAGVDPVDATVAGNDAALELDRAELVDEAVFGCAELLACGAVGLFEEPPVSDAVHHLAALVRGAEHDDATEV